MRRDVEPSQYLRNQSWIIEATPFKHCVVRDVLTDQAYDAVCSATDEILTTAMATPKRAGYDARMIALDETHTDTLWPLLSIHWLETLAAALELDVTFEIDAALHDHPGGSRRGWVHNDFNPGLFAERAEPGEIIFSDPLHYKITSDSTPCKAETVRMRKLAMIFYLGNPNWQSKHGGETGFFFSADDNSAPARTIPPVDNSMVIFECSPHSFHTFLGCTEPRRSLVLWLHTPIQSSHERWPRHAPTYW